MIAIPGPPRMRLADSDACEGRTGTREELEGDDDGGDEVVEISFKSSIQRSMFPSRSENKYPYSHQILVQINPP